MYCAEYMASLRTLLSLHDPVFLSQSFLEERARGQNIHVLKESGRGYCKTALIFVSDLYYVFLKRYYATAFEVLVSGYMYIKIVV